MEKPEVMEGWLENEKQKNSRVWNVLQYKRAETIGLRQDKSGKVGNCGQITEIKSRVFPTISRFGKNTVYMVE